MSDKKRYYPKDTSPCSRCKGERRAESKSIYCDACRREQDNARNARLRVRTPHIRERVIPKVPDPYNDPYDNPYSTENIDAMEWANEYIESRERTRR